VTEDLWIETDKDPFEGPFVVPKRPTKRRKWQRHYVQFPWRWVERLRTAKCSSRTYELALLLVYAHWRNGGQPIVLSNVLTKTEGLPKCRKWRALVDLERLGLVRIERRLRKSPRVTLRCLPR
jgi:hypothetical protein